MLHTAKVYTPHTARGTCPLLCRLAFSSPRNWHILEIKECWESSTLRYILEIPVYRLRRKLSPTPQLQAINRSGVLRKFLLAEYRRCPSVWELNIIPHTRQAPRHPFPVQHGFLRFFTAVFGHSCRSQILFLSGGDQHTYHSTGYYYYSGVENTLARASSLCRNSRAKYAPISGIIK